MDSGISIIIDARKQASTKTEAIRDDLHQIPNPTVRLTDLAIPEISWIVKARDISLKAHFKQLLKLCTSDETGTDTSLSIGLAIIGCIDSQFYEDVEALLTKESLRLVPHNLQEFVDEHKFTVQLNEVGEYISMNPRHCIYVVSLMLNLIGKTLNQANYTQWMDRRAHSYGAALGFDRDSTELVKYQPSIEFCKRFNAEVRARWQLRRRCFIEAWVLSMKPGPIGTAASTVLVLLRGAELTNFASIVQQLLVLHPELMGWNGMASYFPSIIKAYRKFSEMGTYADWIKLLLPDSMVEEFKTSNLRIPFTVARAIAEEYGQKSLSQAEGADTSAAVQELVQEAISIVKVAQGARTVDTQLIRHWRLGNYSNKPLISLLDGEKPAQLQLPPVPSTPTMQERMRDFNSSQRERPGPIEYSSELSLEDIEGIREYSALNLNTEESADADLGKVLDILQTKATQKSLGNILRLPVSKSASELSDRILSDQLVRDLEYLRNRTPPPIPIKTGTELFSAEEIKLLNSKKNVKFSSLVEDLIQEKEFISVQQIRPVSPAAFSDLSSSSMSMGDSDPIDPTPTGSGRTSPVSVASSGELIDSLFDVGPPEDMSEMKSAELKALMSRSRHPENVAKPQGAEDNAVLEDGSNNDEESHHEKSDTQSESSYFEETEKDKSDQAGKTKGIQTIGAMSSLAMEIDEANNLLQMSVNQTPEELFQSMDEKTAQELGVSPLLFSGFSYLTKVSNLQVGHIQALNIVTTDAIKVLSRTEDKVDALRGDFERLCSEIGGLTAEVKKNSIGIRLIQSTLERLLIEGTSDPPNKPPPSSAGVSTRPPNVPPTGLPLAAPISYETYMEMGMAERLKYRKAGGVVPKECDARRQIVAEAPLNSLQLPSQPLIPFTPLESSVPVADKPIVITQEKPLASTEKKQKQKKRTNSWKYYIDVGVSERFLRLSKDQVLDKNQIEKFQEALIDAPDTDKETVKVVKATLMEIAKKTPQFADMRELMRRVNTKTDFLVYLNAMASIREGLSEFQ